MVAFISWLLTRAIKARTGIDVAIVLLLLGMMVVMLVGPAYLYLTTLGFNVGDVAIWEIAVFMMVGMMPIGVLLFAKYWMLNDPDRMGPMPLSGLLGHASGLRASYVVLLLFSEFLMGWTYNLASSTIRLSPGYSLGALANALDYSLTTYWFVFTMVGEMALTLVALRKALRSDLLKVLVIQAVVMFLTPTALDWPVWETYTVYLEAAVMTGLIAYAIYYLRSRRVRDAPTLRYVGWFIVANAVMMVGFLFWLVDGDPLLLALSLAVETVIYFDAVLTGAGLVEDALQRKVDQAGLRAEGPPDSSPLSPPLSVCSLSGPRPSSGKVVALQASLARFRRCAR